MLYSLRCPPLSILLAKPRSDPEHVVGQSLHVSISHEAGGREETYSGLQSQSGTEIGLGPGVLSLGSVLFQSISTLPVHWLNHLVLWK